MFIENWGKALGISSRKNQKISFSHLIFFFDKGDLSSK